MGIDQHELHWFCMASHHHHRHHCGHLMTSSSSSVCLPLSSSACSLMLRLEDFGPQITACRCLVASDSSLDCTYSAMMSQSHVDVVCYGHVGSVYAKHLGRPARSCADQSDLSYRTAAAAGRCCYAAMGVLGGQVSVASSSAVPAARPSDFDGTQHLDNNSAICRRCGIAPLLSQVGHGPAHPVGEVLLESASPAEHSWLRTQ